MVIKGSAAEHDEERLHPAIDVEQEGGKGEKTKGGGRYVMCRGKDGGKWERARRKNWGRGENKR